ncbi:hypothetical protein EZV62_026209 [Acer yangbiense]|uniref:Uncharacterized protein n=1 Tax=Acer yangbiense TaxID=1000413 RepID=A0A5C7GQU3_9ROSI|nr:hypothetical protein EZV62_026209 [Acer yangbiense]
MLQWMGGSRRKVTTSRKSTQKRQKQYFEQRRRQQQQTAVLESYSDHKEHRSLDVLSLLNLSTAAQEHKSACSSGISSDLMLLPHSASFTAPDDHNNTFNGSNYEPDFWNATAEQQISVFDLLAEDGASGNLERSPVHESHVAFSVEGLGKVGTQTPVHSPQQTGRMFQYGCSSPQKAARRPNLSEKFNNVLDDFELDVDMMMQDTNKPLRGSYSEFSTGVMNSRSNEKHKYSTVKDYALFDGHGSKIKSSFDDSDIFATGNVAEDLWDASSSFLDNNFLNEKERKVPGKNWSCQTEEINFFRCGDNEMPDYAFEIPHMQRNRDSVKATDRYNILGSPSPKQQTSEHDGDFLTSKRTRYLAVGRNFDLREVVGQPDWSYYEDARDNLSSLSEESCSSSAVRGEATNELPSISTARQSSRRSKNTFGSNGNMYNPKNIYVKETQYQNGVDMQRGSYKCGSGKGTSTPTQLKPKLFDHVNSPFQEKFDAPQSWLFEEGYTSANMNSGFSSFCQTPKTKFPSSGSKPLMEDAFGVFPAPESHINAKSSYDGSKYGEFVKCSPFGSFGSDFKFNKPFSCLNREGSPTFSNVGFGQSKPDLFLDSESGGTRPGLFHGAGSHGERLFPDLSVQESVSEDEENKSIVQPDNLKNFELGKQSCAGNDCSISENKNAMDSSNTEHNVLERKEAKDGTPERKERLKATYSPEPGEEASSSVKIPDKFHSSVDKKEYNEDAEAPLHCQNDHQSKDVSAGKDDDDARPEQRKIVSKRHGNCVGSSLPVVMLESFVLQLLCVQKKA